MVQDDNLSPLEHDQQQLVEYLDGEIDADAARAVEDRLATDSGFRQSLNELQRSWELLDDLPQRIVDEQFTKTTVEMAAVQLDSDVCEQQRSWFRARTWRRGIFAGLAVLTASAGFMLGKYWLDAPNRQFLQDLPVIERVEVYEHVDNIEFLEQLADEGLFNDDLLDESIQ